MLGTWKPSTQDYTNTILEQSPWKQSGSVSQILAPPKHLPLVEFLTKRLLSTGGLRRYELILGPRRVGKTTVMYQVVSRLLEARIPADRIWWLRLDHPLWIDLSLGDLVKAFIGSRSAGDEALLFIDELTYSRDWDKWLKTFYDEHLPVKIVATTSATSVLSSKSESGVGRWSERFLKPYLLGEYMNLKDIGVPIPASDSLRLTVEKIASGAGPNLPVESIRECRRKLLFIGGFPELLLNESDAKLDDDLVLKSQRTLRADAIERAVYKDIPQSFGIDNPILLERFLYTLAGNVAGVLSPTKIVSSLGMSQVTFDRYISYLERAFLVFTLQNYSGSEVAVQKRGRKLYFVDGAVRNAALQRRISLLEYTGETGLLFENMVATHLHTLGSQTGVRLYYWRDGKDEVDFIYDHPEHPLAIEVASSQNHTQRGLLKFMEKHPRFRGGCYIVYPDALSLNPNNSASGVGSISFDLFLLCVSAQAEKGVRDSF